LKTIAKSAELVSHRVPVYTFVFAHNTLC